MNGTIWRDLRDRMVGAVHDGAAAVLLAIAAPAVAEEAGKQASPIPASSLGPVTIENSQRYRLQSAEVGKAFIIDVVRIGSPFSPPEPDARLPAVFVTDNDLMKTLVPAVASLGADTGQLPSMIVVGIGYDIDLSPGALPPPLQMVTRRATDFTPVHDEAYLEGVRPFTKQIFGVPWPDTVPLGKADAFLAFIDSELKPFIAGRYPVDPEHSTLVGHSLGGLFSLHVFTSPDSFARYVAISPSAQYGDEVLFREEAGLPKDVEKRLFVGLGALDVPDIAQSLPRLDAQIRASARPGLHYRFARFEGATHESVFPGAVMAGLRWVFDAPLPSYASAGEEP